jgi:hypothetical protein
MQICNAILTTRDSADGEYRPKMQKNLMVELKSFVMLLQLENAGCDLNPNSHAIFPPAALIVAVRMQWILRWIKKYLSCTDLMLNITSAIGCRVVVRWSWISKLKSRSAKSLCGSFKA